MTMDDDLKTYLKQQFREVLDTGCDVGHCVDSSETFNIAVAALTEAYQERKGAVSGGKRIDTEFLRNGGVLTCAIYLGDGEVLYAPVGGLEMNELEGAVLGEVSPDDLGPGYEFSVFRDTTTAATTRICRYFYVAGRWWCFCS